MAHPIVVRPSPIMMPRNAIEYRDAADQGPGQLAHRDLKGPQGVATIPSYSLHPFHLREEVERGLGHGPVHGGGGEHGREPRTPRTRRSSRRAGGSPRRGLPTPIPMDIRYRTGSRKPEITTSQ